MNYTAIIKDRDKKITINRNLEHSKSSLGTLVASMEQTSNVIILFFDNWENGESMVPNI